MPARVAVFHHLCDVGNAWAVVIDDNLDAALGSVLEKRDCDLAVLRVLKNIAAHFGDRSGDERRIADRETSFESNRSRFLTRCHDVCGRADFHVHFMSHRRIPARRFSLCDRNGPPDLPPDLVRRGGNFKDDDATKRTETTLFCCNYLDRWMLESGEGQVNSTEV